MITIEKRVPEIGEIFLEREPSTRSFRISKLIQLLDNGQWLVYDMESESYYTTQFLSDETRDNRRQVFTGSTA